MSTPLARDAIRYHWHYVLSTVVAFASHFKEINIHNNSSKYVPQTLKGLRLKAWTRAIYDTMYNSVILLCGGGSLVVLWYVLRWREECVSLGPQEDLGQVEADGR